MNKIFISYTHSDEYKLQEIIKLDSLKNKELKIWYDRKLDGGDDWNERIELEQSNSDICLLLISSKYLRSLACIKEKKIALEQKKIKGTQIISIILEECDWTNDNELSKLLALPTDGKSISKYDSFKDYLEDLDLWLNKSISEYLIRKNVMLKEEFGRFLNSMELLSKSHHAKMELKLEDIFVFPNLKEYVNDKGYISLGENDFFEKFLNIEKIVITGENQSGKTAFIKYLYKKFRGLSFIPIYINGSNGLDGLPENIINKAFKEQYDSLNIDDVKHDKIIVIIDDFHKVKKERRLIEHLKAYKKSILSVDEVYNMTISSQRMLRDYDALKLNEFNPLKRNELLEKWLSLDPNNKKLSPNEFQKFFDEQVDFVETTLGKIFGKGLMPSYPFYIISILSSHFGSKLLDKNITSQGHCYQALIYYYLRNVGASDEIIGAINNFLGELANSVNKTSEDGLCEEELESFIKEYRKRFNLPITNGELFSLLQETNIAVRDTTGYFNFSYNYLFYFFYAKYLAENIQNGEVKKYIGFIVKNLHIEKFAMIAIFIGHHTKSNVLLDELILESQFIFENNEVSKLTKEELSFFDRNESLIIKSVLPTVHENIDQNRRELLEQKSEIEEAKTHKDLESIDKQDNEEGIHLINEIRLAFRTAEVMSMIIKNRSGSLEKDILNDIYEKIFWLLMRVQGLFISIIRNEEVEKSFIDFVAHETLEVIDEKKIKSGKVLDKEISSIAKKIYWNLNFTVIYNLIFRCINNLGSSYLLDINEEFKNKENSPSYLLVYYGIKMQYAKTIPINEMSEFSTSKEQSYTAQNILKRLVVNHCKYHRIEEKKLQQIESKLGIPKQKMLIEYNNKHNK